MNLLVISDSHGDENAVSQAVMDNPDVQGIIFLGDGERDLDAAYQINDFAKVRAVSGNADMASKKKKKAILSVMGHTIF
ncbi:MAG: metallophosphoesterase family protein, partial [Oscillospiraceae bacterium]|nr:metallophosphoesterase family protein [Oscillospiraceae bacterium]